MPSSTAAPACCSIVEKYPWANTLEATKGVEDALEELQPGLPEMKIDPTIFRPADFIEVAFHNLQTALLLGCLLVAVIIVAFLFEWRTALISLLAIPLSLMAGFLVLYYTGSTLNTMILAGFVIAIGVVVDDAIIDVENIVRRLRQYRNEGIKKSTARIILEASLEVRQAIIHATLIDVVVLIPDLLHRRFVRRILPTAGRLVWFGRYGLDGRRPHGYAGLVLHLSEQRAHRAS